MKKDVFYRAVFQARLDLAEGSEQALLFHLSLDED